jgi:hypothetical protein
VLVVCSQKLCIKSCGPGQREDADGLHSIALDIMLQSRGLAVTTDEKCFAHAANAPGWASYLLNAAVKCPNTTYASGWARRTSCTSCGTNIYSSWNTTDETDASGLVAASPNDCCKYASSRSLLNVPSELCMREWILTLCCTRRACGMQVGCKWEVSRVHRLYWTYALSLTRALVTYYMHSHC